MLLTRRIHLGPKHSGSHHLVLPLVLGIRHCPRSCGIQRTLASLAELATNDCVLGVGGGGNRRLKKRIVLMSLSRTDASLRIEECVPTDILGLKTGCSAFGLSSLLE